MADLTLLFVTAGEVPPVWAQFHAEQLAKAPYPLLTLRDETKLGYQRIYEQMLIGAKQATTPFVAMVEDDVLYPPEHFDYRPPLDTFAYDQNRFALFTWGDPTYNWRNRKSNCSLIAPRELLIEALEERFAKWPNGTPDALTGEVGRPMIERNLGLTPRKSVEFFSNTSLIQINHDNGSEDRQKRHRKALGPIRAFDIPYWGPARGIIAKYR